ncbi:LPD1 domain-containing protein [Bacillus swezeyi]|uniref:LPD1 domain-containing protein n=1 Tax=Bacillus swezeyi TaxID=1925020 RepID=UPI001CC22BCE|nr:LPD1 domain-containing protein [Bacillus swezeyi]
MEIIIDKVNNSIEKNRSFNLYYNSLTPEAEKNLSKKKEKQIKASSTALAAYHHKVIGTMPDQILIPSDKSKYFIQSIKLDKGKQGKYWSSNRELAARAFEA